MKVNLLRFTADDQSVKGFLLPPKFSSREIICPNPEANMHVQVAGDNIAVASHKLLTCYNHEKNSV